MFAGGTPPDVFASWQEAGFGDYAARNLMLDLKPFVDASADLDLSTIPEALMKTYEREGKLLGIPFASGASYLFYNKNAFDEAGLPYPTTNWDDPAWTWEAWVDLAKQLTKNYGDSRCPSTAPTWVCGHPMPSTGCSTATSIRPRHTRPAYSLTARRTPRTRSWPTSRRPTSCGRIRCRRQPSLADAMAAMGDPFKTGRIVMNMTGVWGFWAYSDVTAFEVGAAAFPVGKNTNKPVIFTDPWMIARETKHPEEAWKFAKMLVDPKRGAKDYMELTGVVPPAAELLPLWYERMAARMPWLKPEQLAELIVGSMKKGYESANHLLVGFNQMESMVNAERQAIFLNKATAAEVMPTIKQKLDEIAAEVNKQFGA